MIKMTSKETIKEFEHLLKVEKDRIHKDMVFITALENAIEALEKQIPKKVKKEFRTVGGAITSFETDVCPNCGMDFYIDDLGQTMYCDFCPDCGQALDWGGEDE